MSLNLNNRFYIGGVLILLLFSCSNLRTQTSNPIEYKNQTKDIDSISFVVNGKSVIQSSRDIDSLKSRFDLYDYNMKLDDSLKNYNDTNEFKQYRLELENKATNELDESLMGTVLFIVKKSSNKIVHLRGYWFVATFDDKLENKELPCRLLSYVTDAYFPVLKGKTKCEDWWSHTIEQKDFREIFLLEPPVPDEDMPYEPIYNFYYDVSFE